MTLTNVKNRFETAFYGYDGKGEDGASNLEAIVWIAVVLIVTVALLLFGGAIKDFVTQSTGHVDTLTSGTESGIEVPS